MTAGQINKMILNNGGHQRPRTAIHQGASTTHGIGFYPANPAGRTHIGKNKPKKNIFGNSSKKAITWISGPNHELCLQHVPGYKGHVPGILSENVFAKGFGKTTQIVIGQTNPRGHDLPAKIRFKTTQRDEFSEKKFRRIGILNSVLLLTIVNDPEIQPRKDYEDYTRAINQENP